jgi:glucose-1-phosphate cytidylyltransferase
VDVVILCGGKGTRAHPFSDLYPKVMMPVSGTPILVHLMRIYADQGFNSFVLAAGHRKEILYDYFEGRFSNWKVRIVDTGSDTETAERIRRCLPFASETFFATYGDGLGDVNLKELLDTHRRHGRAATLTSVPLRSQYGTVHFDERHRVQHFEEKPIIRDCWINAGFFAFQKSALNTPGENLEREVLPVLGEQGELFVYQHQGFWRSMDTSKDQQEIEALMDRNIAPWQLNRHMETKAV